MGLPIIDKALENKDRKAITDHSGSYTYHYLNQASASLAAHILDGVDDLHEERVAFMIQPSMYFVACQWAIWRAGAVAVPLHTGYPLPAVEYVLEDAKAKILIVDKVYKERLLALTETLNIRVITIEELLEDYREAELPLIETSRNALIIYTSGTTAQPKGVVSTHEIIESQVTTLVEAWQWEQSDHILNVLPLHHVHGLINALACPLWVGACCEFLPEFDEAKIWSTFEDGRVNVFMAVPTIYYKLISFYDSLEDYRKKRLTETLNKFRLMVSGSAALPISVMNRWEEISGHKLLERYGMTEIGMALSNPYEASERRPGFVGQPLPNVQLRLMDEETNELIQEEGKAGEIQVKGPNVFKEYWGNPEATTAAFTLNGWFKTGDIAMKEDGAYRILGRKSTDIIKSGGYKLSALEIEEELRKHEAVKHCAIVALPDEEWGEIVAAAIVPEEGIDTKGLDQQITEWLRERIAPYKLPRRWVFLAKLPRNAMGKVTKNELKSAFNTELDTSSEEDA
jgi:malonyl-CoA/methylmalonyl-CoA synthetase